MEKLNGLSKSAIKNMVWAIVGGAILSCGNPKKPENADNDCGCLVVAAEKIDDNNLLLSETETTRKECLDIVEVFLDKKEEEEVKEELNKGEREVMVRIKTNEGVLILDFGQCNGENKGEKKGKNSENIIKLPKNDPGYNERDEESIIDI